MDWRNKLGYDIGSYANKQNKNPSLDQVDLTNNLSPLTNFILNSFVDCIDNKNLIVTFPNETFRPKLLLAHLYTKIFHKSTLIFTGTNQSTSNENSNKTLSNNYQLLNRDGGTYLFYDIPITIYKHDRDTDEDKLFLEMYLPRANKKFKQNRKEIIKNDLLNRNDPKIILSYQSNFGKVQTTVSNVILEDESIVDDEEEHDFDLNIGCIILEDADRFISNQFQCKMFIEWIKKHIKKDMRIVLHFNNPDNEYIEDIKKELDSLVISFNKSLLMSNSTLSKESLNYFENVNQKSTFNLIERYNIDSEYYFKDNLDIKICTDNIESNGIDELFINAREKSNLIDAKKLKYSQLFYSSRKLMYDMYNLSINPAFYRFGTKFPQWHSTSIENFLEMYRNTVIKDEKEDYKLTVLHFINSLSNLYVRFSHTKKFGEEKTFSLKGKDYKLFDILSKKDILFGEGSKIVVGTVTKTEPNQIKEIIRNNNLFNLQDIEIEFIGNLNKRIQNKQEKILILPGLVPDKYLSKLYEPYIKILILSYEGLNEQMVKKQISILKNPSLEYEKKSLDSIKEIYDYLHLPTDTGIFADYFIRVKKHDKIIKERKRQLEEEKGYQTTFSLNGQYKTEEDGNIHFPTYEEFMANWSKSNIEVEKNNETEEETVEYESVKFNLFNLATNEYSIKKLPVTKTFFTFKDDNVSNGEELSPNQIEENDYILIIENNVRRSLLDLVLEINNLEASINSEEIEYWKEKLLAYLDSNNMTIMGFYDKYLDLGGTRKYQSVMQWAKGMVLGPQKAEDLRLIGEVIGDKYITTNYEDIMDTIKQVRSYHMSTGRKLKKMINYIISDEDISSLNKEELIIYDSIKDGIYKVIEKK